MDAFASAEGSRMNGRGSDSAESRGARAAMDQSASHKPLAKSVALKLKKLRARLAKKELETKLLDGLSHPA